MKKLNIRLTFTRDILGTICNDPEVHKKYLQAEARKDADEATLKKLEAELAALPAEDSLKLAVTRFYRDPQGRPALADYQVKGFIKEALETLLGIDGAGDHKIGKRKLSPFTCRGLVDALVFVTPRWMPLADSDKPLQTLTRPLRAMTPQGPRVALATSELIPEGTAVSFTITILSDDMTKWVTDALEYGAMRGLGQWRNAGYGSFTVEVE
jgi:hypothetical protein